MADTFKVGELLNERSPFSKTFMNFDGSRTVEVQSEVIHFQDTEGNFHNIDTELYDESMLHRYDGIVAEISAGMYMRSKAQIIEARETGDVNRDDFDFQGLKVPFVARLPRIFSKGYMVSDGEETLIFKPVQASPSKGYIDPANKSAIRYQDVWNDADVKLELKKDGVKETIILKSDKAPRTYLFEVEGSLSDDLRAGRMQLSPAWLMDANGTYRDVEQALKYDDDTGQLYLGLDVDTTDLAFPVYVDPTVVISHYVGPVGLENDVRKNSPTTVTQNPANAQTGYLDAYRLFLKYPDLLSGIPSNAQILDASYNMFVNNASGATNVRLTMHGVMTDYDSGLLNWNNQPAMDATLKTPELSFDTTINKWVAFDVKTLIQAMLTGSQVKAFGIKQVVSTESTGCTFVLSKNAAFNRRPNFKITYNIPPDKPTVVKPNGGEAWNSLETIQWTAANDMKDFVHEPFPFSSETAYQDTTSYGQVFTVPDDNVVMKKAALRLRVTATGAAYTMYLTKAKAVNDTWTFDKTQILAQQSVTIPSPVTPQWVEMTLPNLTQPKGTHLALHIEMTNGNMTNYYASVFDGYFDQTEGNGIASGLPTGTNFLYRLNYTAGTPANQMVYQIQLTSNNGSTWKTIVNATPAGATSYPYDFINETESATSKLRIRAYDGYNYGDWDESDGVFTIVHNVAPTMPTNLAPNGTIEDRATVTNMSWTHNDPNGNDPQSKFDLQWRVQGNANWTTVTQSTVNQFYNAPANLFAANSKIEWRVRTYDQAGLAGPYSTTALFTAAVRTAPPTVTYPTNGASVPIARPVVQWSHPNQVKFWLRVKNGSTTVFNYEATGANKALTVGVDLVNNTAYTLELAVMDENGLWSTFTTVPFQVSYTGPNKPVVTTTSDNINGRITLNIETAEKVGTTPDTSYYDIFRKADDGSWTKLASGLSAAGTPFEKTAVLSSNFVGKVTGSLVENPNMYKFIGRTTIATPSEITSEVNQVQYNAIMTQDGVVSRVTTPNVGHIPQALFSYDMFKILEDYFGVGVWNGRTTNAEKREIAIKIITYLTHVWWGFGNSGTGGVNKATIALWQTNTNIWENTATTSSATPARLQNSSAAPQYRIDANGYAHMLAYGEPMVAGTGVLATDYDEYQVTVALKGTRVQWTDYLPTPTVGEQYFVRAYAANGTVVDSDVITATAQMKSVQIALASDPTKYVTLDKRNAGKEQTGRQSITTDFVGRPYPLTEFSDNYSRTYDYLYKVYSWGDVIMARSLAQAGEALCLRDNWGKKDYVTIDSVDIEEGRIQWNISIQPIKVYYVEGIL